MDLTTFWEVSLIRFDSAPDDISVIPASVLFDVDTGDKFQAIELFESFDATRGGRCRRMILRLQTACGVQSCSNEAASHVGPIRSF